MVDILKHFLRVKRTGSHSFHLASLYDMLPYFIAIGLNLYAKTIYSYICTKWLPCQETILISWFGLVGFYVISTIEGYLMPNPFYTYALNIYDLVSLGFMLYQPLKVI